MEDFLGELRPELHLERFRQELVMYEQFLFWLRAILTRVLCASKLRKLDELAGLSRAFMLKEREVRNFCCRLFEQSSNQDSLSTLLLINFLFAHVEQLGGEHFE